MTQEKSDVKCLWVRNEKSRGVLVQCFSISWEGKAVPTPKVELPLICKRHGIKASPQCRETHTSRTLQIDKKCERDASI